MSQRVLRRCLFQVFSAASKYGGVKHKSRSVCASLQLKGMVGIIHLNIKNEVETS